MADENEPHEADAEEPRDEMTNGGAAGGDAAEGIDPDDNPTGEGPDDELDAEPLPSLRRSLPAINRSLEGELVVHYPQRDVCVALDGDAALRVMAIFSGTGDASMIDLLHPSVSMAANGWLALDTQSPLAMTWIPPYATSTRRTTVDPVTAPI